MQETALVSSADTDHDDIVDLGPVSHASAAAAADRQAMH